MYCSASCVLDTVNSSVRQLIGSCRMFLVLYREELLRLVDQTILQVAADLSLHALD